MSEEEKNNQKVYEESWNKMIDEGFRCNPIFKDVLREMTKGFRGYRWHYVEELLIRKGGINEEYLSKGHLIKGNRAQLAQALKYTGLTQTEKAIHVGLSQAAPKYVDRIEGCTKRLEQMLPTKDNDEYSPCDQDRLTESPNDYSFMLTDDIIVGVKEGCIKLSSSGKDGTCIIMMKNPKKAADRKYYKVMVEGGRLYDASKNPPSLVSTSSASGSENGHEWVDLGLSVKWATCNVGADSPGGYGDYFAWGETSPKSSYTWENLRYRVSGDSYDNVTFSKYVAEGKYGTVDSRTRLELSDDAARQRWGGSWRMPTREEFQELVDKCRWSWTTEGGHAGYKVTGPNGRSIFLPAAGYRYGSSLLNAGEYGYYWSSSLGTSDSSSAGSLDFNGGDHNVLDYYRYYGHSVRSVTE